MTALLFNPSAAGVGSGNFTHALSRRVGGYTVGILSSDIIGYPSLAPTKPGHADASSVMPGMESDYYNKVWVIPDLIEVPQSAHRRSTQNSGYGPLVSSRTRS
jgi:hypothetical protein